jgi:hypothetical protein
MVYRFETSHAIVDIFVCQAKTPEYQAFSGVLFGEPCRNRTCDTLIKSQVLYRLS